VEFERRGPCIAQDRMAGLAGSRGKTRDGGGGSERFERFLKSMLLVRRWTK
jgi:hypothetical protein